MNQLHGLEAHERRFRSNDLTPIETLRTMQAVVLLQRLAVPMLAVAHDGTIVFVNEAFAAMVGHTSDAVLQMTFTDVFPTLPANPSTLSVVRLHADALAELAHRDGTTVHAKIERIGFAAGNDRVALVTFEDLTERMWTEGL